MASVFYNILDLAGINARILFKEQQQQESSEESPAAADRAEGRTHGGERSRSRRHKVGSSGNNHRSSSRHGGGAGPKELQTEPNVGHLKCHKPECGNCEESGGNLQTVTRDHNSSLCVRSARFQLFRLLLLFYYILLSVEIKCFIITKLLLTVNFCVRIFLY